MVYDRWEGGKRDKSLAGFLDYFKNNLVNDIARVGLPIKRAEYVMAVWRLGLILEKCHSEGLAEDLERIEECGVEILEEDPILAILAGLARLSREDLVNIDNHTNCEKCDALFHLGGWYGRRYCSTPSKGCAKTGEG